jgi:hypothetical protein
MVLCGMIRILFGVQMMGVRHVCMMCGFLMLACFDVLGGFMVMLGSFLRMSGCILVMIGVFLRHRLNFDKSYVFARWHPWFLR